MPAVMTSQETAAHDLEQAAAEVAAFIRDCPETVWSSVTPEDGRTVGSLAYHCAAGNDLALGWMCQVLSLRPIQETSESHDAANAEEAARSAHLSKDEVQAVLARTTARAAAFVRTLTDEELERRTAFGISGREITLGPFMMNFGRHMRRHLETMRQVE
jgi:hypothetical protein